MMRSGEGGSVRSRHVVLIGGVLAMVAASLVLSAQIVRLRFVSTPWPPFTGIEGQPRFAIDLVNAALQRIGMTSTTTIVAPADFTKSMTSDRFEGSAAAWKDPERERYLIYSQPYMENRLVLVGRHGTSVAATTLAALKGKRLSIVDGYSYGDRIVGAGPVFVRSKNEEDSLHQLLIGSVEYTLVDELVVKYLADNYPEEVHSKLEIGTTPLLTRQLHLVVRRTVPGAQSVIDRFNAQLKSMVADRTYHKLLHVDWIRADVDGDGVSEYVYRDDHPGPAEPQSAYTLFLTNPQGQDTRPKEQNRYYVGGSIYESWASVPEPYKTFDQVRPSPGRSTASIFTFQW